MNLYLYMGRTSRARLLITYFRTKYVFLYRRDEGMEEPGPLIQRRAFERIPANIGIRFFFGNANYSGIVTNISRQGMCIRSLIPLSPGSLLPVIIRNEREVLIEHVRVKYSTNINSDISAMGVELLYPSPGYLEFVNRVS